MEKNLQKIGIYKLGDIANMPIDMLRRRWGVIGEQIFYHSHGIDLTIPYNKPVLHRNESAQKGFAAGITLLRDYQGDEILDAIFFCQIEEVTRRGTGSRVHI
jgi:DNA polymerase V